MYAVDRHKLNSQLAATFVQSERDIATDRFLADASRDGCDPAQLLRHRQNQLKFLAAQRQGMSRHDASAAHQNVTLMVASTEQFRRVLAPAQAGAQDILDIGAGRGEATAALGSALSVPASRVTIMESSSVIRRKLSAERGFRAVASFAELGSGKRFGAVALLNVLDRCDDPMGLLGAAVNATRPDGVLLVATVLPFCPRVYEGVTGKTGANRPPKRAIHLPHSLRCPLIRMGKSGDRFMTDDAVPFNLEQHVSGFVAATVRKLPLRVAAWTRVPYLATGTVEHTYYHLENVLLVLRRTQQGARQRLKTKVDEIGLTPS